MKGHGFDLEASQLKQADRIGQLFLGFGLVFVWLITWGNWLVKRGYHHLVDHKSRCILPLTTVYGPLAKIRQCHESPESMYHKILFWPCWPVVS